MKNYRVFSALLAAGVFVPLLLAWQLAAGRGAALLPGPLGVLGGFRDLLAHGLLWRYVVASLFRVTWGFALAVVTAVPLGLLLGYSARAQWALGPIVQLLRPISPLAWIPIAILWFGVGDGAAIFLIFLGAFFPLLLATAEGVRAVPLVHLRAGRNFGLSARELLLSVLLPAAAPQLWLGARLALGVGWLVVVAAEMLAVNSGLGFLIVDARNAGNRYDLVLAGMVTIGVLGLLLDWTMRTVADRAGVAR
jgi:NitT/TauT family transport system permease protein